jgi:1-acyl-sn-glycerol-3-phosphate acyltransferase
MNRILRMTLAPWLIRRYNVSAENTEIFQTIPRPFVVLPNHTSVWDPFMVNAFVPGAIHYVVSDANFRSRLMEFGLGLVGSIPKTKVMSDLDAVKNIMKVKDRGGVVGIFPEGQNTWDGHTLPILYSTAKLVKLLRVPVVTARIAGAFLSCPRWGRVSRKGSVSIRYRLAFMPDELRAASVDEIDRRIAEDLDHDEFEYNRSRHVKFVGEAPAEYIERALFACPQCGELGTIRSEDNIVRCTACDSAVRFGEEGFFEQHTGPLRFDNMHAWSLWQADHFRSRLDRYVHETATEPLLREDLVNVEIGYKSNPLEPFCKGSVQLLPDRIELVSDEQGTVPMPISDIRGINVQNNERLEFYHGEDLYRLTPSDPRSCTYKWDLAVRHIQSMIRPESQTDTLP